MPNGAGFSYKGKTLVSGGDPAGRAERAVSALEISDRTLYLCPSPLFAHGLDLLLRRLAGTSSSAVLCVEAEPELFPLAAENMKSMLGNRLLRLVSCTDTGELCAYARREWPLRNFAGVKTVRLNGGWQLHRSLYDEFELALRKEIACELGNAMTLAKLGRRYARNAVRNLSLLPSCSFLSGLSFGNSPVLLLAAGPSLDKTLDLLRKRCGDGLCNREKRLFRIVCVDTCLPVLAQRGITPDLVVVLESQHWNLLDFTGLSGWKVPVAMDLSALPRSAGVLGGVFLFFTPWTQLSLLRRLASSGLLPPPVPALGSVGLSATAIALSLSSGPVVASGLDFSFTADMFHARSSPGHASVLRRQTRLSGLVNAGAAFGDTVFKATAKNGANVLSTPGLRNYRDMFEREFAGGKDAARLFDIEGSGLPLGLEPLPHEKAFDILCTGGVKQEKSSGIYGGGSANAEVKAQVLKDFAATEKSRLLRLREMLTGTVAAGPDEMVLLFGECDYLWAHFPDYAAGLPPPSAAELEGRTQSAVSFLKRIRAEIDPFLALWSRIDGSAASV